MLEEYTLVPRDWPRRGKLSTGEISPNAPTSSMRAQEAYTLTVQHYHDCSSLGYYHHSSGGYTMFRAAGTALVSPIPGASTKMRLEAHMKPGMVFSFVLKLLCYPAPSQYCLETWYIHNMWEEGAWSLSLSLTVVCRNSQSLKYIL